MRTAKTKPSARKTLANHELVVLAAYLTGGKASYADTEDIAVKANEIAPGRFAWRKYKDQIDIGAVRKRLWDATKLEKGGYLIGTERNGWVLTQAGLKFCKKHLRAMKTGHVGAIKRSQREQTWIHRERIRMLAEPAFQKFSSGQLARISPVEAERFFRIDDYVVGAARKNRIERSIAAFNTDPILADAIRRVAGLVRTK